MKHRGSAPSEHEKVHYLSTTDLSTTDDRCNVFRRSNSERKMFERDFEEARIALLDPVVKRPGEKEKTLKDCEDIMREYVCVRIHPSSSLSISMPTEWLYGNKKPYGQK